MAFDQTKMSPAGTGPTAVAPARSAVAVTPHDSTDLAIYARALYVGGAGNVALVPADGSNTAVTFVGVPAGTILPIQTQRVNSTNTTATSIVAIY